MLSVSFWTGWKRRRMSSLWPELRLIPSNAFNHNLFHNQVRTETYNFFSGASLDDRPKAFEPDQVSESCSWQNIEDLMPSKNYHWSEITFQWSWILEMQDWGRASPASMPQVFVCCNLFAYHSCCFVAYLLVICCCLHTQKLVSLMFSQLKILNSKYKNKPKPHISIANIG